MKEKTCLRELCFHMNERSQWADCSWEEHSVSAGTAWQHNLSSLSQLQSLALCSPKIVGTFLEALITCLIVSTSQKKKKNPAGWAHSKGNTQIRSIISCSSEFRSLSSGVLSYFSSSVCTPVPYVEAAEQTVWAILLWARFYSPYPPTYLL